MINLGKEDRTVLLLALSNAIDRHEDAINNCNSEFLKIAMREQLEGIYKMYKMFDNEQVYIVIGGER